MFPRFLLVLVLGASLSACVTSNTPIVERWDDPDFGHATESDAGTAGDAGAAQ